MSENVMIFLTKTAYMKIANLLKSKGAKLKGLKRKLCQPVTEEGKWCVMQRPSQDGLFLSS
jgi:hypothetical protein